MLRFHFESSDDAGLFLSDTADPALLESRQQLLSLLTAEGQPDAAAVADMLLARPALVPGLLPAAGTQEAQDAKESEESQESQQPQETSQESQESEKEKESPAMTREQLSAALEALVMAADPSADSERQVQIDKQKMMVLYFKVSSTADRRIINCR